MILHDVCLREHPGYWNILIRNGRISSVYQGNVHEPAEKVHLDGAGNLALPGFINSHDHLDFNLFPQLGTSQYRNYREWGPAIQSANRELIDRILKIPQITRTRWGIYKNLLNGFTTVVNHGAPLKIEEQLIDVFQEYESLHSPGFERKWKRKLNNLFKIKTPLVIHAGEGIDEYASNELDKLTRFNFFKRKIIVVHGVAMVPQQAVSFRGLVWCPASNLFMFGKTAAINQLKEATTVVFGTDSTLTSPWNAWEHFRSALQTGMSDPGELLDMLGMNAASLFGLKDKGSLTEGAIADIILINNRKDLFENNPADFFALVKKGEIKMADEKLASGLIQSHYSRISFNGQIKFVYGNIAGLVTKIRTVFPEAIIPFDVI